MHEEQRRRAARLLHEQGLERALFASPASVTWLTGFAPPSPYGPSPFAGGPPLVWYEQGSFTLLVIDGHQEYAEAGSCAVESYTSYTVDTPITSAANLAASFAKITGRASGRVGIELQALPAFLLLNLQERAIARPIDGLLTPLRMIKTDEELARIRAAFALVATGHAVARQVVAPGRREIDIWTAVESAVQQAAGRRLPMGLDCSVGYREQNIGALPVDLEIRPGDSFILDLSMIYDGYWADSCATYYGGQPDERQIAMHKTVAAALEMAIGMVRPGAIPAEIDQQLRAFIAQAGYPVYPHHSGHGIGVTPHEEPRIVPYCRTPLEAGMVIMLEPGIYLPGQTAVRLEDAVLVTAGGAEVLSRHDKSLP